MRSHLRAQLIPIDAFHFSYSITHNVSCLLFQNVHSVFCILCENKIPIPLQKAWKRDKKHLDFQNLQMKRWQTLARISLPVWEQSQEMSETQASFLPHLINMLWIREIVRDIAHFMSLILGNSIISFNISVLQQSH